MIVMDDANSFWRVKSVFGEQLKVPNFDRICSVSIAFHAAYCQVAACGPSRASFMSGLAPHQTGIFDTHRDIFEILRPDQMWSYRLKEAGYYCSNAGKVHHGYRRKPPEISDVLYSKPPIALRFGSRSNLPRVALGDGDNSWATTDPADDRHYYDHQSASDAIAFLNTYDREAPFYREVGFHAPHIPLQTPVRFKEMYDENAFVMPGGWLGWRDLHQFSADNFPQTLNVGNDRRWRLALRDYFSALSHADWHIGRVWDALKNSAHSDDTVVLITSDHGYHLGDKNRFRKFSLWEEADGVPLIIHDPEHPAERVVKDPVALIDVGPTVMDYADLPPIVASPGVSLRPQIKGAGAPERVVPSFYFGSAGVRDKNHRFISYQDGHTQLADLDNDPWQLTNSDVMPKLREEIERRFSATIQEYGLTMIGPGQEVIEPTEYVSCVAGALTPKSPPTGGVFTQRSPNPQTLDVPGNRRIYIRHYDDMRVDVPAAYRVVNYGSDVGAPDKVLDIHLSDAGHEVDFIATHAHADLRITCGTGDDRILVSNDRLTAELIAGRNLVRAGSQATKIEGGSGHDTVFLVSPESRCIGGSGELELTVTGGGCTVETAAGKNRLEIRNGTSTIHLCQGIGHLIISPDASVTIIFGRTGLPVRVEGFSKGVLDISAWSGHLHRFMQDGADVILETDHERARFIGQNIAAVQGAIRTDP